VAKELAHRAPKTQADPPKPSLAEENFYLRRKVDLTKQALAVSERLRHEDVTRLEAEIARLQSLRECRA
jgi:hypothetical protein